MRSKLLINDEYFPDISEFIAVKTKKSKQEVSELLLSGNTVTYNKLSITYDNVTKILSFSGDAREYLEAIHHFNNYMKV